MYCQTCGASLPDTATFCGACGKPIPGGGGPPLYAGFWRRFVAYVIDDIAFSVVYLFGVLVMIALVILVSLGGQARPGPGFERRVELIAEALGNLLLLLGAVVWWLYLALLESSNWQATLGKKAMGLVVTDLHGQRITFGRALGRNFAKFLSWVILAIGFIMAGFSQKKQALHDRLADCLVIRKA